MSAYDDILARLDRADFERLEEREPEIVEAIRKRLKKGDSPEEIGRYVRRQRPHRWVEGQAIEAAARFLSAEG